MRPSPRLPNASFCSPAEAVRLTLAGFLTKLVSTCLASRLMIKQMATIEAMVSEGLGVSLAPATSLAGSKKIRTVSLSPKRFRSIGLLLPAGRERSRLADAWIGVVEQHFGLLPQA